MAFRGRVMRANAAISIWALMAVAGLLVAWLGLWTRLGAHPWWGFKVALYGLPLMAVLAGLSAWRRGAGMAAALAIVILSIIAAHYGKAGFAASLAENTLAGRAWFLGWIGIAGAAPALAAIAAGWLAARRRQD